MSTTKYSTPGGGPQGATTPVAPRFDPDPAKLQDFRDFLFADLRGSGRVAFLCCGLNGSFVADPRDPRIRRYQFEALRPIPFHSTLSTGALLRKIALIEDEHCGSTIDWYMCPSLFVEQDPEPGQSWGYVQRRWKDRCHPFLSVARVDIDHDRPLDLLHEPSLTVHSGSSGHRQLHFRFRTPQPATLVETINKALTIRYDGDPGKWARNDLLRLPSGFNHKSSPPRQVTATWGTDRLYEPGDFRRLIDQTGAEAAIRRAERGEQDAKRRATIAEVEPGRPTVQDALAVLRANPNRVTQLIYDLLNGHGYDDRSKGLFRLGCEAIEAGFSRQEVYTLLYSSKFNKFVADNRANPEQLVLATLAKCCQKTCDLSSINLNWEGLND
jgi:hypothetical protein